MGSLVPDVSIVIPVKDEAGNIFALAAEIAASMENQAVRWECIWIDDGSTDGSLDLLAALAQTDPRHRYISFERNAGQSAAFWAGFREAKGGMIATLDGDGQNDPADIPGLMRMVKDGTVDMACGYRRLRKDNSVRRVCSRIANAFRELVTGRTPIRDVGCGTKVFRRECVSFLPLFGGMHRFLPTLCAMNGYKLAEAPVNHRPRKKGKTKYSINNRLWVGLFDLFGVLWLRKRSFHYSIRMRSDSGGS